MLPTIRGFIDQFNRIISKSLAGPLKSTDEDLTLSDTNSSKLSEEKRLATEKKKLQKMEQSFAEHYGSEALRKSQLCKSDCSGCEEKRLENPAKQLFSAEEIEAATKMVVRRTFKENVPGAVTVGKRNDISMSKIKRVMKKQADSQSMY